MRNHLLHGLLTALLFSICVPPIAAAPMQQAPGYFRAMVGDFTVTALQDGVIRLDATGLKGLPADQIQKLLADAFQDDPRGVPTSVNVYVVDTGTHRILVDGGNADCYGWTLNGTVPNLRAAGYKPEDIDIVVLTHLHGDHVCGLATADGKPVYPNATVWVADKEVKYWFDDKLTSTLPGGLRAPLPRIRETLRAYGTAFHTFKADDTIVPGMRIVPAYGHTPGHTAFLFESKGAAFLAFGDIVHFHAVEFAHPEVFGASDPDVQQTLSTRLALFEQIARNRTLVVGSHLPFPGIGHIRKEGKGFVWVPIEFGPIQK